VINKVFRHIKRIIKRRNRNIIWNEIIDQSLNVISDSSAVGGICGTAIVDKKESAFRNWLNSTELEYRSYEYPHKKALEFFFSIELLDIGPSDHLLDAAGGHSGYLKAVRQTRNCGNLTVNDHIYTGEYTDKEGIRVVGGDIGCIGLEDRSLSKISCHHAFEHFQGNRDAAFIRETGRLLTTGGRACIIPLFIVDRYTECWNVDHNGLFDARAQLIIDKSASIPGADEDGHFARFYSLDALRVRVLEEAEKAGLVPSIATCRLDGNDLPDMDKNFGSMLNSPLMALLLEKT
jgi:predicted SAM-dependent methyltransferase